MATTPHTPIMVPLHLSGNTSEVQNQKLQEFLQEAAEMAYKTAIEHLDKQSAQLVLDAGRHLKAELVHAIDKIIEHHTFSDKYKDEQVPSNRVYSRSYKVRPIEAQVSELRKFFPQLKTCNEKLARRKLPDGAEDWFAVPNWESMAQTYNDATEEIINLLASKRKFQHRLQGKLNSTFLRMSERSKLAWRILSEQQEGQDILIVAGQFGLRHRGCSARRARVAMSGNEFGLGTLAVASMLLTHPERLSSDDALMIDCGGDEYSVRGDYTFDRVPLFDYDIAGVEFSIFYEDRARNLWGTPSGFLYKLV